MGLFQMIIGDCYTQSLESRTDFQSELLLLCSALYICLCTTINNYHPKKYPSLDSDYVISSDLLKLQFASVVIGVMNSFPFRNAQKYSVTNQGLHLEFLLKTIIFQGKCVLI